MRNFFLESIQYRVIVLVFDSTVTKKLAEALCADLTHPYVFLLASRNEENLSKKLNIQLAKLDLDVLPQGALHYSFLFFIQDPTLYDNLRAFSRSFASYDISRVELPVNEFGVSHSEMLKIIQTMRESDYVNQAEISKNFYDALSKVTPYTIDVHTPRGCLMIQDKTPLFDLSGPITPGSERILPGGEVAYTGSAINGVFTVTTGFLATPTSRDGVILSKKIMKLSHLVNEHPITFYIKNGTVSDIQGDIKILDPLCALLPLDKYNEVVEVGFAFNHAVPSFIHDWPAASNEGTPGVHIAIGSSPVKEGRNEQLSVHVDLISGDSSILVNDVLFVLHDKVSSLCV